MLHSLLYQEQEAWNTASKKREKEKKKPRKSVSPRPFAFTSSTSNVPIAISLSVSLFLAEIIVRRVSQQDFVYHGSYRRLVRGS